MSTALIILAAGQGTRMNSELPKVLHPLGSVPLLAHVLAAGASVSPEKTIVVTGHGADAVRQAAIRINPEIEFAQQSEQLGTGHAVAQAASHLSGFDGDILVLFGDTPFIRPETITRMQAARKNGHDIVVLGFNAREPGRYGRLVMSGDQLLRIVEAKDATDEIRAINLCNSGVLIANSKAILPLLKALENNNASQEYYLTDVVELARAHGLTSGIITCDEAETLGINTRIELARAEAVFQQKKRNEMLANGVTLIAPETVFFALDTHVGRDSIIEPNVFFGPGVTVESGANIRAFSHLEGCHISSGATVGPFARLRPGAELAENAKVGNFVEIKNAQVAEGAKISHLSYIGDASVGRAANIGAGTITCNYDGVMKHHTEIGDHAFIGSNTMLVAPVSIGAGALTASGSVITRNVPKEALAIARARQEIKPGLARKLFEKLKSAKKKRGKEV